MENAFVAWRAQKAHYAQRSEGQWPKFFLLFNYLRAIPSLSVCPYSAGLLMPGSSAALVMLSLFLARALEERRVALELLPNGFA